MKDLPKKKVTFFFTDIEGSTQLAQELAENYPAILEEHQNVINNALYKHKGRVLDTAGDGFFISFDDPLEAVHTALEIQTTFAMEKWAIESELKVRIGIHTGEAIVTPRGFIGIEVHRSSRICQAAHGGQTILSGSTYAEIKSSLAKGIEVKKLGPHLLKGFEAPENLYQLGSKSTENSFPPLRIKPKQPIVAVLPFRDIKHAPGQEHFGEGMAEEIIIALGRIPGIQVVSRSLAFALTPNNMDAKKVGKALNATAVLEGSIRILESKLRLMIELVDTKTGYSLWGEIYDGNLSNVFDLQDEIARQVAETLHVVGKTRATRRVRSIHSSSIAAYNYFIRGRQHYFEFSKKGVLSALEMFNKAIEEDEKYAMAHSGKADCYAYLYMYDETSIENLQLADESSSEAIELDPLLAEGHASRGFVLSLEQHFDEARQFFEKAIELDPKLFKARYLYGRACFANGQLEKAGKLFLEANMNRPEDFQSILLAAQVFGDLGQVEKSMKAYQRGLKIIDRHLKFNPKDARALYMSANAYAILGKKKKALAALITAVVHEPDEPMVLYNAACIYALLGMKDEAMRYAEKSVEAGLSQRGWYENDSNLDSIRQSKRFQKLLHTLSKKRSGEKVN